METSNLTYDKKRGIMKTSDLIELLNDMLHTFNIQNMHIMDPNCVQASQGKNNWGKGAN